MQSDYTHIFTGSMVEVHYVKNMLQEHGIGALIKDDHGSAAMAGFFGGIPDTLDLFVLTEEAERAMAWIESSINDNHDSEMQ